MDEQIVDVHKELFREGFLVFMPYSATVSGDELRYYGVVGFHDKESLTNYLDDDILVRATPVQMAEALARGDRVTIRDTIDVPKIYNLVTQHLENWYLIGMNYAPSALPPLADLTAFDELAEALYPFIPIQAEEEISDLDYVLGNDLVLLPTKTSKEVARRRGYNPYTPLFIDLGLTV